MTTSKKLQDLLMNKLDSIESELKEVRQKDIPNLRETIAVIKTESKTSAKITAAVITIIGTAVSSVIAWFK